MSANAEGDGPIYIGDLAEIINREVNTIRKWERMGKLPKHLIPRRGDRDRRYWTHSQVYGPRGIIAWMKKHDMRPGREFADPNNADKHVRNLRRPKHLNKTLIKLIRTMVKNKATSDEILEEIYPHTKYTSKENLETAIRSYFQKQGWVFPKRERKSKKKGK